MSRVSPSLTPSPSSRCSTIVSSYAEYTISDLRKNIATLEKENKILTMENCVLENYLRKQEPTALVAIEEMLNAPKDKKGESYMYLPKARLSSNSTRSKMSFGSRSIGQSVRSAGGRVSQRMTSKVNTITRIDITQREIEESDFDCERYTKNYEVKRNYFKAVMEEIALRIHEIKESRESLEGIVENARLSMTARIPGEKLLRFSEEWLRKTDTLIGKLRLRKSHLLVLYHKVKSNLAQKEELGETVHPVDFDQIRIDNAQLINQIDLKMAQLLEMKKIAAQSALVLNVQRKFLFEQIKESKLLQEKQLERQLQIEKLQADAKVVQLEVCQAINNLNNIQEMTETYTVPNVQDYVNKLAGLKDLRKMVKIWCRKRKIQQIGLVSAKTRLKRITGSTKLSADWYQRKGGSKDVYAGIEGELAKIEKLFIQQKPTKE